MFLSKGKRIAASTLFVLLMIFALSRCDFSTKVIASADPPDVVFEQFIGALRDKDYGKADALLADGATMKPVNETGYGFFEDYVNASLTSLSCESVGEPVYDGTTASLEVSLNAFNKPAFVSWTKDNMSRLEHEYMVAHELKEFDKSNRDAVDKVMSLALSEYSEKNESASATVKVNFVFSRTKWKIVGNDELVTSIFGGIEQDGQTEKEPEKKSQKKSEE